MPPTLNVANTLPENKENKPVWEQIFNEKGELLPIPFFKKPYTRAKVLHEYERRKRISRLYKSLPALHPYRSVLLELDDEELITIETLSLDKLPNLFSNAACVGSGLLSAYCGLATDLMVHHPAWVGALKVGVVLGVAGGAVLLSLIVGALIWKKAYDDECEQKELLASAYINRRLALQAWEKCRLEAHNVLALEPAMKDHLTALQSCTSVDKIMHWQAPSPMQSFSLQIDHVQVVQPQRSRMWRALHHRVWGPALIFVFATGAVASFYWTLFSYVGMATLLASVPFGVGLIPVVTAVLVGLIAAYASYRTIKKLEQIPPKIAALEHETAGLTQQTRQLHNLVQTVKLKQHVDEEHAIELRQWKKEAREARQEVEVLKATCATKEQELKHTCAERDEAHLQTKDLVMQRDEARREAAKAQEEMAKVQQKNIYQQYAISALQNVTKQKQAENSWLRQSGDRQHMSHKTSQPIVNAFNTQLQASHHHSPVLPLVSSASWQPDSPFSKKSHARRLSIPRPVGT